MDGFFFCSDKFSKKSQNKNLVCVFCFLVIIGVFPFLWGFLL